MSPGGVCGRALALLLPGGATADDRAAVATLADHGCATISVPTVPCARWTPADWSERQDGRGRIIDLSTPSRMGGGVGYAREVERMGVA